MARETRTIRAPRGTTLSCNAWPQEAGLPMLMNNLDPDVAEKAGAAHHLWRGGLRRRHQWR